MNYPDTEYQIGSATFVVGRVFPKDGDPKALITQALVQSGGKNRPLTTSPPHVTILP